MSPFLLLIYPRAHADTIRSKDEDPSHQTLEGRACIYVTKETMDGPAGVFDYPDAAYPAIQRVGRRAGQATRRPKAAGLALSLQQSNIVSFCGGRMCKLLGTHPIHTVGG